MENRYIALILYRLASDMDFWDYMETSEADVEEMAKTLSQIENSALKHCLETIAYENMDILDKH